MGSHNPDILLASGINTSNSTLPSRGSQWISGAPDLRTIIWKHTHEAPAADLVFAPTLACGGDQRTGGGGSCPSPPATRSSPSPTWCRLPAPRWAGLTPKPHHAQQPKVALRGSLRLRLASTFNHRPAGTSLRRLHAARAPGHSWPGELSFHPHEHFDRARVDASLYRHPERYVVAEVGEVEQLR